MAPYNLSSLLYSGRRTNAKAKFQWSQDRFLGNTLHQSVAERRYCWINIDNSNLDFILGIFK